jgi:hypothetical protein
MLFETYLENMEADMRKQFEKWYADEFCEGNTADSDLITVPSGDYISLGVRIAWTAWQAAWGANQPNASAIEAAARAIIKERPIQVPCGRGCCSEYEHDFDKLYEEDKKEALDIAKAALIAANEARNEN